MTCPLFKQVYSSLCLCTLTTERIAIMHSSSESPEIQPPFFSKTIEYKEFGAAAHLIDNLPYVPPNPHTLLDELRMLFRVLREARRARVLLLDSSNGRIYPDLLACVLLGFMPRRMRPAIALVGDMWQPNDGPRGLLERVIIRLADRGIDRYAITTTEELEALPRLWGIDRRKLRVCPFHASFSEEDLREAAPPVAGHIFAGGNSNRDYRPLVEAARHLPEHQFILATNRLHQIVDPPPNVTAGPLPHEEFVRLMRSAAAVVVPVRQDLQRSSGQQTYLNAMLLKKPVIVNEVFGAHDHISSWQDGIIVDGTPESFAQALRWVLDPANAAAVAAMGEAGHKKVLENFTARHFVDSLIAVGRELALERAGLVSR